MSTLTHRYRLWLAFFGASLGGWNLGYDFGAISVTVNFIKCWTENIYQNTSLHCEYANDKNYDYSNSTLITTGLITGILFIAMTIAALVAGFITDKIGRKNTLILAQILQCAAYILMFVCRSFKSPITLIVGRFLSGISNGLYAGAVPTFLNEIKPKEWLGVFKVGFILLLSAGNVGSNLVSMSIILGKESTWHYIFVVNTVANVIAVTFLLLADMDSPEYSAVIIEDEEEQQKLFERLSEIYSDWNDPSCIQRVAISRAKKRGAKMNVLQNYRQLFSQKGTRYALLYVSYTMTCIPLSGIIQVVVYITSALLDVGFNRFGAELVNLGIGILGGITSFLGSIFYEKISHRPVLMITQLIQGLCMLALVFTLQQASQNIKFTFVSIALASISMVAFKMGPSLIVWATPAAYMTIEYRATTSGFASSFNWFFTGSALVLYPIMYDSIGTKVYYIYAVWTLSSVAICWFFQVEAKGKSNEECLEEFSKF